MFQNNEAFAFLPGFLAVISIYYACVKGHVSGRSAAFSSLSQRSRFYLPKNSDQISHFGKSRVPEGLFTI